MTINHLCKHMFAKLNGGVISHLTPLVTETSFSIVLAVQKILS